MPDKKEEFIDYSWLRSFSEWSIGIPCIITHAETTEAREKGIEMSRKNIAYAKSILEKMLVNINALENEFAQEPIENDVAQEPAV